MFARGPPSPLGSMEKKAGPPVKGTPAYIRISNSISLFLDAVYSIACFSLAGFDLQTVLLGRSGQEAPHAVRLPAGGLPDLAQRGSLRSSDQRQDLGALALRAR